MNFRSLLCLFSFAIVASPGFLHAQDSEQVAPPAEAKADETKKPAVITVEVDPRKGPAYVAAPKGDANYDLMGEFVGSIATAKEDKPQALSLQIRPLANDSFQAIAYFGGLPGQENYREETTQMVGRRSDDLLVLSGGPWAIFVEKNGCVIIDRTGKQLGRLERVERVSPTMHAQSPVGATVMFDGSGVDQFADAQMTEDGLLTEGSDFLPMFQDFNLHVEYRLPYMPLADGQQRGNSGLYLQSRYECQVLDSFGTEVMINGLGALYKLKKPDLNMCFPPLVWQTYDVQFTAPRWSADGSKTRDAHITSWINGVKVQDDVALPGKTGAGKAEEPLLLPIRLQDHGDPVRYRNIWVVDRGLAPAGSFPVLSPKDVVPQVAEEKSTPADDVVNKPEATASSVEKP